MDRQTLRDWAHRFNEKGPAGLINGKAPGPVPKLSPEQKQELKRIVETGPDPARHGVVRCRCVDLRRIIKERFDVDLDEVSIGRVLKELGFAHVSPRPRHPKQDPPSRTRKPSRLLKKLSDPGGGGDRRQGDRARSTGRDLVPG